MRFAVLAVVLSAATILTAAPDPCNLAPYFPITKDEPAFEHALRLFIYANCYETLGWQKDKLPLRDTGPWIAGWSYGTHPAVRIWYSPEVIAWMDKPEATRGTIPDNAIIVKEQHSPPASAMNHIGSWTVMVRDNQAVWDGWYWAFYSAPGKDDPPPPPTPPLPELGDTSYPDSMFGNYCVNCHASTTNPEVTYAASSNIHGRSMGYTVVNPSMSDPTVTTDAHPDAHEAKGEGAPLIAVANRTPAVTQFLAMMAPGVTPGPFENFPGVRWDHVVAGARPHGPAQFLTSDQCLGCHDATQNMDMPPNMIYPASGNKRGTAQAGNTYNLSPYGEWRNSLMGLAGRDPVFFAQLASERTLHDQNPQLPVTIQNTCFRCHGAMGQRQLHIDSDGKTPFAADMVMAWNNDKNAKYGALAREGISCTVCHHIAPEGLGTPATFTGQFNVNKPNEIYGPYTDPLKLPMDHGVGMTPVAGAHLKSSALCGSCHAIKLPVLNAKGEQVGEEYEQTTYLEWLNSDFQNEKKPFGSTVQTCQACHMPGTFKMQGFDEQKLAFRIANIEDNTYADVENRAPDKEITMPIRTEFSRHTLVGMNVFVLEMFRQRAADLGIRTKDPMSGYWQGTQGLDLTQQSMVDLATNQTATVEILSMTKNEKTLDVKVRVTNKAGHSFPSGVSFRRAFLEFEVLDAQNHPLWASGATNRFGVITDGVNGATLPTEFLEQQQYQPHYQTITKQSQVQIYEELVKNPEGQFTTSFLALADRVKSNRLQPRGWKKNGPWAEETKPHGDAAKDPDYANGSGADTIVYSIPLSDLHGAPASVSATVFYQTIPPYYLRQRFTDSTMPDTYRLMDMAGGLKTADTPFPRWKLRVTGATKTVE